MQINSATSTTLPDDAEWLAFPLFDDETAPPKALEGHPIEPLIARLLVAKVLPTGLGDVTPIHGATGLGTESFQAFGLGKREALDAGVAFAAGVALAKKLAGKKRGKVAVLLPDGVAGGPIASALVEGLVVGTRGADIRRAEPGRHPFGSLVILAPGADRAGVAAATRRGGVVGEAINLARDLSNTPPGEKAPPVLAALIEASCEEVGVGVTVWDEAKILAERFGGLTAVALGSDVPPRFVVLDWNGGGDGPRLALVGKGVTFDSGGLSLKPSASMEDMKNDMTGAAVVFATIRAAALLKLPVNVTGYLPITENMTGGRAMKLGDVLTMRNGKTVEVLNTDAEGRLILADALSYAAEASPDAMIDLATLTGACLVALGNRIAGLFSNDDALAAEVTAAGRATGERTWRLPLDDDFKDAVKSTVADLKNVGNKWGGAITAAKFLEQFVGTTRWAHLDIAGPSWADSESSTRDVGGTGCFVRTLVGLLEARA